MPQFNLGVNRADRRDVNVEHQQRHRKCKYPVAERGQALESLPGDAGWRCASSLPIQLLLPRLVYEV
jgi:hypothetical protein